jgi:hypothetical protein
MSDVNNKAATDGVCTFQAGHKIDPNAVSTRWVREEQAAALVRQARHDAGRGP